MSQFPFIISTHDRFSIDRSIDRNAKWKRIRKEILKEREITMQSYELLYLGQLLNALLGSFYLFIYLFFLFFEALVILDPCLSVYTEFAFTVKRIYRFLGLARIQKSHFNYTHCSTYICVYTEKRTNDPWKKEHPSKKIFERYRMHGFRNTTFSYFFSIYRAEEDIEKR